MSDLAPLDHPIWNALVTGHAAMARRSGRAARYPSDVSPLSALQEPTPEAFRDMAALVIPGEVFALFTDKPVDVPAEWQVLRAREIDQMICERLVPTPAPSIPLLELGDADMPEMLALAAATEPGPFLPRTNRMGRYRGLRAPDGRLMAMAGERLRLDGYTEISAVCTAAEFRGRGYARALVSALAIIIAAEGRTPILHMKTENEARRVYEKLGFRVRRAINFTVIRRP